MKKKLYFGIGVLLVLLGIETLFFSQINPIFIFYLSAGLLLMGYSWVFKKVTNLVHTVVAIIYAIPLIMIAVLAIYGGIRTADFTEDVVFVLGAGLRNDAIGPVLEARLDQALLYFEQNDRAIFIVCGGYGEGQTISEARAMADFLIAGGIPEAQILLENASTSTYENFRFALDILNEEFPDGFSSVVVTNVFHQYRAGYLARHLGISPARFAAQTPIFTWHHNYVREIMAVFNSWLFQT